jgi:hypothetical protein
MPRGVVRAALQCAAAAGSTCSCHTGAPQEFLFDASVVDKSDRVVVAEVWRSSRLTRELLGKAYLELDIYQEEHSEWSGSRRGTPRLGVLGAESRHACSTVAARAACNNPPAHPACVGTAEARLPPAARAGSSIQEEGEEGDAAAAHCTVHKRMLGLLPGSTRAPKPLARHSSGGRWDRRQRGRGGGHC